MVVFERYQGSGVFLPQGTSNAATARIGLLLIQDNPQQNSFTVNSTTWMSALYVFFAPSGTRDWITFAQQARALLAKTQGMQFAFLAESTNSLSVVSSFVVDTSGGSAMLTQAAKFKALNVTLNVQAPPVDPVTMDWDDVGNQFTVTNLIDGTPSIALTIQNAVSGAYNQSSTSQNMLLPLTGPLAGCVNSAYPFELSDLDTTEAGLLYFAPPSQAGDPLTALRYPLIKPASGNSVQ